MAIISPPQMHMVFSSNLFHIIHLVSILNFSCYFVFMIFMNLAFSIFLSSDPNQKVIITAGDYNVLTNDGTEQTVAVRVTKHPQYDEATASNDIALLKFDTPLGFSDSVRPACIVTSHPPSSSTCYASGWGRTDGRPVWKHNGLIFTHFARQFC